MKIGVVFKIISMIMVLVAVILIFPTILGVDFSKHENSWFIVGVIGVLSVLFYLAGNSFAAKSKTVSMKAFEHTLSIFYKILGVFIFLVGLVYYIYNRAVAPHAMDMSSVNVGTLSILVISTVLMTIGYFISKEK